MSAYLLFRGYALIVISMFTILVTVMIANLNPKSEESSKEKIKPPGDIIVHIVWPNGDTDVDLWVYGPGEPSPVGYANKAGILWNLLRDDRGNVPDATPINYEDAFTRGVVPGEYIVNVQCFRCARAQFPMTVDVAVSKRNAQGDLAGVVTSKVVLTKDGEEKTAVRFIIMDNKDVDRDSINNIYKKLVGNRRMEVDGPVHVPEAYQNGGSRP